MNTIMKITAAFAVVVGFTTSTAVDVHACGAYGPPPMSQTLHAALSSDARVAASAFAKLLDQGQKGLAEVEMQRRWLPREARQLDWQIKHNEGLLKNGSTKLTEIQEAKHALRLANLRLARAELKIKMAALESLSERLGRAIKISLVVT